MKTRILLSAALCFALLPLAAATETENLGLAIVPAPGPVRIDGKIDDWDLSGGIFSCAEVERLRDSHSVWYHAMYDDQNLYVLGRFRDPTPLGNQGVIGADHPWENDCLQFRTIVDYDQPTERVVHFTCWQGRAQKNAVQVDTGRGFKEGSVADLKTKGAQQAYSVTDDGGGYLQEIAVPLDLITNAGRKLQAGDTIRITFEVRLDWGVNPKECFWPGTPVDRIFAFRAYRQFGPGRFEKGTIAPRPVRLADGREFPVALERGMPVVDWTGLVKSTELPGFKEIRFTVPQDGFVSLNLKDKANGRVVRQLLSQSPRTKGEHVVRWDGLSNWYYRTPGQPLPAGEYAWEAIWHPGLGLRLQGWVNNGGTFPWSNGQGTNWGGDHGTPISCEASADRVYLAWSGAEAGQGILGVDLTGKVLWSQRYGYSGTVDIALDGDTLYVLHEGTSVYPLDAKEGIHKIWNGRESTELAIAEMWGEGADVIRPNKAKAIAAREGKLLLALSSQAITAQQIVDWPKLITLLEEGVGPAAGEYEKIPSTYRGPFKQFAAGKLEFSKLEADRIIGALNRTLSGAGSEIAWRKGMELAYAGAIAASPAEMLALVDTQSGKIEQHWNFAGAMGLVWPAADRVLVLQAGQAIVEFNPQTGAQRKVLDGLKDATCFTLDPQGRFIIGLGGAEQRIAIYDAEGRAVAQIGTPGGRPERGKYNPAGLRSIRGVAVDGRGQLWAMESTSSPKRVSTWDLSTGKLVREFFGPTHYGASGGATSIRDPYRVFGEGAEWQIDPKTGRGTCLTTVAGGGIEFARYGEAGGREYLTIVRRHKYEGRIELVTYERLATGDFRRRSIIYGGDREKSPRIWWDVNDDESAQENEVQALPWTLSLSGANGWSCSMNTDLSVTTGSKRIVEDPKERDPQKRIKFEPGGGIQLQVKAFTPCGAPVYDVAGAKELPSLSGGLASLDNKTVLSLETESRERQGALRLYDVASGSELWNYPNDWTNVHGSHRAPPGEPGLLRGVFGAIGTAKVSDVVGHVWAINTNVGEWHLVSEKGFYISRLFEGDRLRIRFPEQAIPGAVMDEAPPGAGGEDFGGSMTQTKDGRVYIQSGKTANWNLELVGLDKIRAIGSGDVALSAEEALQAARLREELLQQATGTPQFAVKRFVPEITGDLNRDFKGATFVTFEKSPASRVKATATYDDSHLYLAYEVQDATPWVNGADLVEMLYARGDTVDFQLATDPKADAKRGDGEAGDLRLSIGPFQGKPTAVLYRRVSTDKHPKTFASGVVAQYRLDSVRPVEVNVKVKVNKASYIVEAVVPWEILGTKPVKGTVLRGDFGVTHGTPSGDDTGLRTYWSNQQTGIVDDEVFELKLQPQNWGELKIE